MCNKVHTRLAQMGYRPDNLFGSDWMSPLEVRRPYSWPRWTLLHSGARNDSIYLPPIHPVSASAPPPFRCQIPP